jgi:ABC-type lipoprotein export system ATPase subunit
MELAATDVGVEFGHGIARHVALDAVHFATRPGELCVISGPSGSGKTTLLSVLGLLMLPSRGRVLLDGDDVAGSERERARVRLRRFGFVYQHCRLLASLSAVQNVMLPMELAGTADRDVRERARRLLAMLGLERKLDARPATLSGGERQRVAIARALANDPDAVLADEPTAALDEASSVGALDVLKSLSTTRIVIVVSHDERVWRYADRRVHLENGRCREIPCTLPQR